jgi:TatD DNase family protein
MIDTHAHIYTTQFDADREKMLQNAFDIGVKKIFMPNIDHRSIAGMLALAEKYPQQCFPMMGIHPVSVGEDVENRLQEVENWLDKQEFVAVGEIGLDLYWSKAFIKQQEIAFTRQIELAKQHYLPIVIHCRNAFRETMGLLKPLADSRLRGIFHCFSGTLAEAQEVVELNFRLGIGGVVTFKNGGLDLVLPHIGLEHLVLETDCPYLAPVPHRGKRNEPAYLPLIARKIAELKKVNVQEVIEKTDANALEIFG